jgi:hypothetical protein
MFGKQKKVKESFGRLGVTKAELEQALEAADKRRRP